MKIISYSLWGNNPTYLQGAIENAKLASLFYPDWISYFYLSSTVSKDFQDTLKNVQNVVIVKKDYVDDDDSRGMFWRFEPISFKKATHVIIRDTDSRLSIREGLAVADWIDSEADVHIMRDHPYHNAPILGGMWGIKGGLIFDIISEILKFNPTDKKGQDQLFLNKLIYEKVMTGQFSQKVHDPFYEKKAFPGKSGRGKDNNNVWFIGQCFNSSGLPNSVQDIDTLLNHETNNNISQR